MTSNYITHVLEVVLLIGWAVTLLGATILAVAILAGMFVAYLRMLGKVRDVRYRHYRTGWLLRAAAHYKASGIEPLKERE